MDKLTDDEYLIAGTLADLIAKVEDIEIRYKLAVTRYEIICQNCGLGTYKCSVKMPYGPDDGRFCDMCLETELFTLWKAGVHTVSSCCGHGRVPPYIQVLHGESVQKMHELGYKQVFNEARPDNQYPSYHAKTYLPCFTPCKECTHASKNPDGGGYVCDADDYDSNFSTYWCFVPKPPKEG